ncbi:transposable element Tc1 transposase [Trichonephila clavipes]|nr:transposable element Tc1 transposase [Trichonephila clavipes]
MRRYEVDVMGECLSSIKHVVGLEEGRSVTSVAAEFGIAHSIVSRLWRQFQATGTAIRGFSSGRPRGTTPAADRYIVLQARRNRRQTAGEIARHTTQATGRPISRFTVARRLHGGGLFARCPVRCVPLTPAHRRRRSLWCREHRNWRDNEWGRVLFTDESRFSLSSDSHRILIWRERKAAIIPRTSLKGTGSVNGTRYCNEILLPYVRLFRGAMGLQFLFMDDNAPCHRTVATEQLLESEDIERMDWPARSPDLNPIEHVWDFLGRRLAARTLPPVTIRELRLARQDEWAEMPQQLIDTFILSMGRRCKTCLVRCKQALADAAFFAHPSPSAPLALHVDASDYAIGGALHQVVDSELQPLAFFSRKLTSSEKSYSAYDRELLAIYSAIRHSAKKSDKCSPRQIRQLDFISQFTTNIVHIPGSDNIAADVLSRVSAITFPSQIDYDCIAETQQTDQELHTLIASGTSLELKR